MDLKKTSFWFLPVLAFTLLLCSCTQRAIGSQADELRVNSWSGSGEYSTTSFDIHSMGGADTRLYGDCLVDDHTILLTDSRLKKSLEFDYELSGDEVKLSYDGGTINLNKD